MWDNVLPLIGDNAMHKWQFMTNELVHERVLYDKMLKKCLPPQPIQALVDEKYAYLQKQIILNEEWIHRPRQYPILLCLLFIKQKPNPGATLTFRPRTRKRKTVVDEMSHP